MVNSQQEVTAQAVQNAEKTIEVYDFGIAEQRRMYQHLNLDDSHPNMLNPSISESEYETVTASWSGLHQQIGNYLASREFKWETGEPHVGILHRFYFKPDGSIHTYFFKVINEDVSPEKRAEYAQLINSFSKDHKIDFKRETPFAQCGKTRYPNQ